MFSTVSCSVICFMSFRWYQATKSNNQAMAAKVDSLKDEMDEALNKVEICKVIISNHRVIYSAWTLMEACLS